MANAKLQTVEITNKAAAEAPAAITEEDIAQRAYALFLARGAEHGRDVDDWLEAEQSLRNRTAA